MLHEFTHGPNEAWAATLLWPFVHHVSANWHYCPVVTHSCGCHKGESCQFPSLVRSRAAGVSLRCGSELKPWKWGDTWVANMQTRPFLLTKLINRRSAWMGLMRAAKKNPRFVMAGILRDCWILMVTRKHKLWANVSWDLHLLKKTERRIQKAQLL